MFRNIKTYFENRYCLAPFCLTVAVATTPRTRWNELGRGVKACDERRIRPGVDEHVILVLPETMVASASISKVTWYRYIVSWLEYEQ